MIHINLLPYRVVRKSKNIKQQVGIFFGVIAVLLIAMYIVNGKQNKEIKQLNRDIQLTQNEVARYNKISKEVEELKRKLELLKQKMEVIQTLDLQRDEGFRLLEIMTEMVIKNRMWFTRFEAMEVAKDTGASQQRRRPVRGAKKAAAKPEEEKITPAGSDVRIKIDGIALDQKTVADFMLRLQGVKRFKNVRLMTLQLDEEFQNKGNLKRFQVVLNQSAIKPADESAEETAKKTTSGKVKG